MFVFFKLAGLALLALWVQAVVAGDAGVFACAALSVIDADRGRIGVAVVRLVSQTQQAAAPVRAKSPVTWLSVTTRYS